MVASFGRPPEPAKPQPVPVPVAEVRVRLLVDAAELAELASVLRSLMAQAVRDGFSDGAKDLLAGDGGGVGPVGVEQP